MTVDVKKYIHLLGQWVLCRVHVGVAEAWVVRVRVLSVEDCGVVVAHPARLVRRHLHSPGCARALSPGPEPARGEGGRSGWEPPPPEALQVRLPSEERGSFTDLFSVGEWERWEGKVSK